MASLRTSRDSLREKIKSKFKEKGYDVIHRGQGSFAMNTIIAPSDGDYDIDDGTYLQVEEIPEQSTATMHKWVVDAAKDHTSQDPSDKNPCVRIFFQAGYHVDLVVYYEIEGETSQLAHKTDGWVESDPIAFKKWFNEISDESGQLKRIIRYFKGWRDKLQGDMPSGLVLTILAANHFVENERDDIAFLETMKAIKATLEDSFECIRPTIPNEDLFADYAKTRKDYFFDRLETFIESGEQAIELSDQKNASKKWRKHFDQDRFQLGESTVRTSSSPAFISHDARSA